MCLLQYNEWIIIAAKHMQGDTKAACNKYSTGPRVSLCGDGLTTGGDGHAERDGKREKRAAV